MPANLENSAVATGMEKTRDLFKKIRDTKGTLHAKMGSIRTETVRTQQKEMILKRGGKNTKKNCTKKIFMTQIITMVWSLSYVKSSGP